MTFCISPDAVWVRVAGRANFNTSNDLKRLVCGQLALGHTRFVLDLSGCLMMDSTFLGVIIGMATHKSAVVNSQQPEIELFKSSQRVLDLLDNLGVVEIFKMVDNLAIPAEAFVELAPPQNAPSKVEVSKTCLEAHQTLMEVNPANIPKFKDVTTFLEEEIRKQEGK